MTAQQTAPLESGTYEIIRKRLDQAGDDLRQRLVSLNKARKSVFGSVETKLIGSSRITTENNCSPRDIIAIGQRFLFGYNVQLGLRSQTTLKDVFSIYEYREQGFHPLSMDLIDDAQFQSDFQALYKYYKKTVFARFAILGAHLFMKFRVGKSPNDFKTFKWLIEDDHLIYQDNRSDHEFHYPAQHEFEWARCRRDSHRQGAHPHISIEDRVFVETVGGDLTIKLEDNTETGQGIYAEPVANMDQTLDDAEIFYASIGSLIVLKIKPYGEKDFRYLVFNEKLGEVKRIDALADACVLLPNDHGLIFPNGFYLLTGEFKQFDTQLKNMSFFRRDAAPNGEDILYTFLNRLSGEHILLHYNLIEQQVATPILCHGYSIFVDGKMIYFRDEADPQKHHALQIWQTPFGHDAIKSHGKTDSPLFDTLFDIGNKPIVRCMAECQALLKLLAKEDSFTNLYVDIVKKSNDLLDSYFWINQPSCSAPGEALAAIRTTAETAIQAYEKVSQMRKATNKAVAKVSQATNDLKAQVVHAQLDHINEFVQCLAQVRSLRGEIITTRDLHYVDLKAIDHLETQVQTIGEDLSEKCIAFLLRQDALDSYREAAHMIEVEIPQLKKGSNARRLEEKTTELSAELEMLIDIVSNLKIDDPTETTRIIDQISSIFADLNQLRAGIENRQKELATSEGVAEFNAQLKLLDQAIVNYLGLCDSTDKTETYLTKLMIGLEELEGRFSEFDDFLVQLAEKREEIYSAFENRRLQLLEARNKRAVALASAAERVLKGIANRIAKFTTFQEINGYFAGDFMVEKVRDIVAELIALEDAVKADDIQTQLKVTKEEAARQLRDRQELFAEGENIIKLGKHRFLVNVQSLVPTVVPRDSGQYFHLTGTNFFQEIQDEHFNQYRDIWEMICASETTEVYRSEYLAYLLLKELQAQNAFSIHEKRDLNDDDFLTWIQAYMGPRYDEAYTKGIHDIDAANILRALLTMAETLDLLTASPRVRALAELFWAGFCYQTHQDRITVTIDALKALQKTFPETATIDEYINELEALIIGFLETSQLFPKPLAGKAAGYLLNRLLTSAQPPQSNEAIIMYRGFCHQLEHRKAKESFQASQTKLIQDPHRLYQMVRTWVRSYQLANHPEMDGFVDEVAVLAFRKATIPKLGDGAESQVDLSGMKGTHDRIKKGNYHLNYHQFMQRLSHFESQIAPRFHQFQAHKHHLLEQFAKELRLDEFKPHVLSSFVRNQLIDQTYLPLIGSNLAKQIGSAGEDKRTDRMGMLLLVSPPGYGKTTLMEYIANRLGLIFMKINGPAIGHEVTSLDPAAAPNASAREELNKLNLALEMGDNIMIYLDDIQHCNPEFLQKFISLCDGQRKIEGVYAGHPRTYDLRGKKVCVVMAGNPYTESGEKFQIPDMLANRADTYNLGDMAGSNDRAFKLSYIENCLTSNPVLNRLAGASQKDIRAMVRIAETDEREGIEFEGVHSPDVVSEYIQVLKHLLGIRDIILKVNQRYIHSAAQEDAYRTEPPFKLQGSYRNMNKMAARVLPIMNEAELTQVILNHYENEAQTLTTGAEANLLKFKQLMGLVSESESARWLTIVTTFAKRQSLFGMDPNDKIAQVILQLSHFQDGLKAIHQSLDKGMDQLQANQDKHPDWTKLALKTQTALAPESLQAIRDLIDQVSQPQGADHPPTPSELVSMETKHHSDSPQAQHLYRVLRHQFTIMHHWLKPMYDMDLQQNQSMDQLQSAVKASLGTHTLIIEYLEQLLNIKPTKKTNPKKRAIANPKQKTSSATNKSDGKNGPPKRRVSRTLPKTD